MGYRIRAGETPERALHRIAREQLERALEEIESDEVAVHETVHAVRKRCKKLRGLLRLHRPALAAYASENAALRDAARTLSLLRDATALIESCDALADRCGDAAEAECLASLGAALRERRAECARELDAEARLANTRDALCEIAARVEGWRLDAEGFGAIGPGAERTYRRARTAMAQVRRAPTAPALHEWRKRVKYHRYHLRLLRELWPPVMAPLRDAAKHLSDRLGDDRDLLLLRRTLLEGGRFDRNARDLALAPIDARRAELLAWSFPVGDRLFAEKPKRFRKRLRSAWRAWQVEQSLAARMPEDSREVS